MVLKDDTQIKGAIPAELHTSNIEMLDCTEVMGIDFLYLEPGIRGKGVANILINRLIRGGMEYQIRTITVDFESTNWYAKRCWLRHFSPMRMTVIRKIDNRFV